MMKCSCLNCTDRYPGCHGKCDDYKKWKEWLNEQNDMRYRELKDPARKLIIDHQRERHERWRKGTKRL